MSIPVVIIVGRPNVGKSALFNCIAKRRISIVDPTCGVTRDRVSTQIEHGEKCFELLDTGGIGINDVDRLDREITDQIEIAIHKADLLLFVVDIKDGITPLDIDIAEKFRKLNKPTLLVVNKVDNDRDELCINEFFKMGFGTPFPVSAVEKRGRSDLLDEIIGRFDDEGFDYKIDSQPTLKIAIVGKRNVGKSTLINTLAKEERVIVSEVAGTTRDSVDVEFELKGNKFVAIDTAGLRKKSSIQDSVEFYSKSRTESAIRRADVVLFVLDVTDDVSQTDKKLGDFIKTQLKPCVIVCNKWDLVKKTKTGKMADYIDKVMPGLSFAPISFISAMDKENIIKTIELTQKLFEQAQIRVATPEINKFLENAMSIHAPKKKKTRMAKIYYGTQVSILPPTFVLFVNDESLFDDDYERYLANQLRNTFEFSEIPLRIIFKPKVKDVTRMPVRKRPAEIHGRYVKPVRKMKR